VTAVELDPELARIYKELFPNDKVIVADAHQYLLDHYSEFDFIWSSPPCPSHSRIRLTNTGEGERKSKATYADMKLYEEIILLQNFFKGKYCVENVISYYEPLIKPIKFDRHYYWSNFAIDTTFNIDKQRPNLFRMNKKQLEEYHKIDLSSYKGNQRKDKILRNLVEPSVGKMIFECANSTYQKDTKQIKLF
jgi:DNA (cytosine-5)-methyltransferase 1|tara:strand:+ start:179 stop:754 length:576 start_codon:yes stop_codon:yes gene_type:complete